MKRILGIVAIMAITNYGFAQGTICNTPIPRPVQDIEGDGAQGLYGTPDPFSQHPNDTFAGRCDLNGVYKTQANNQNIAEPQDGTSNADADRPAGEAGEMMLAAGSTGGSNEGYNNNDPFYNFINNGRAKDISVLGRDPEFPFLARLSSSAQVYHAIKKHADNKQLNDIITGLGFTNGIQYLAATNVTSATIPGGTTGNMGSGHGGNGYYRLVGANGFKAWKVTADNGAYVYFLQACGNEFYPNANKPEGTACVNAAIKVDAQPVTITANGQQNQVTEKTFVYYHEKGHRKHVYTNAEINDNRPSRPLLLSTNVKEDLVPQTYNVTVTGQNQNQTVCSDSTVNVEANINVEKTSSYSGYYNSTKNSYTRVSKRVYMKAGRKMRKAERKEEKVARMTKTTVETTEGTNIKA